MNQILKKTHISVNQISSGFSQWENQSSQQIRETCQLGESEMLPTYPTWRHLWGHVWWCCWNLLLIQWAKGNAALGSWWIPCSKPVPFAHWNLRNSQYFPIDSLFLVDFFYNFFMSGGFPMISHWQNIKNHRPGSPNLFRCTSRAAASSYWSIDGKAFQL